MKKSDIAQKAINNNIMVQRAIFESDIKSSNILKFIYINNGVVAREVFTFSTDKEDRFYSKDVEYQLKTLEILNLITEKSLLKKKFIFLTPRAVQIVENKEEVDNASLTLDYSKLSSYNDVKLTKLITKNKTLARLINNIKTVTDVEDINKQIILNNMIYVKNEVKAVSFFGKKAETFPKKKTIESIRNTNGKKLINSNIYRIEDNIYYVYVDATMNKDNVNIKFRNLLSFFDNNYDTKNYPLKIYTNLMYSKILLEIQAEAKDKNIILESLINEIDINEVKEKIILDMEAKSKKELQTKLDIARKYISVIYNDLIKKGFLVEMGTTQRGFETELEIQFPSERSMPCILTINQEFSNEFLFINRELFSINIKKDDSEEDVKRKVISIYKEMLKYMQKTNTDKFSFTNRNKYKFTLKELE